MMKHMICLTLCVVLMTALLVPARAAEVEGGERYCFSPTDFAAFFRSSSFATGITNT